jgi:fructose-1,6-bisphosphatase/inositol monophosphatase family enzyme
MPAAGLHEQVAALLRRVARDIVLPNFRNLSADQVSEKAPGDLVTVADQQSEAALTEALAELLPGARVIGEEAVATDPSLLDGLDHGLVWLVDPIDGTSNYAEGIEPFAIMVALLADGVTQAGWILDPVNDRLCHAQLGQGAFVDGAPVSAHGTGETPPRAALALRYMPAELRDDYARRIPGRLTETEIPRCAGAQYPQLVLGNTDIALFWRMLPWDHAAGALFLTEAGGRIAHYDGTPYRPGQKGRGLIAAATPALWDEARAALLD